MLNDPGRLSLFRAVCAEADACLSSTPDLVPFYKGAGARKAEFVPTPYPVDFSAWDFSRPVEERRGIFLGTREFNTLSRNHLGALLAVRQLDVPVTVVNPDGGAGRKRLAALAFPADQLRVIEGRMSYPDYLAMIAQHRLVFQLDRSAVPGQVAGDALLCRIPCVGGDGAVERIAFPNLCGDGRETAELIEIAASLLGNAGAYMGAVAASQAIAAAQLSFRKGAENLKRVFCGSAPGERTAS